MTRELIDDLKVVCEKHRCPTETPQVSKTEFLEAAKDAVDEVIAEEWDH